MNIPLVEAAPINNEEQAVEPQQVSRQVEPEVEKAPEPLQPEKREQEIVEKEPVVEEAPAPKPQPTKHPVGCENYRNIVSKYSWNVNVALNVMRAESGCNPSAVGDNYPINGLHAVSCGLFQIRTLAGRPSCTQLKDPATNVEWAWKLYQASGWKPWTVCNKGIVSCY